MVQLTLTKANHNYSLDLLKPIWVQLQFNLNSNVPLTVYQLSGLSNVPQLQ